MDGENMKTPLTDELIGQLQITIEIMLTVRGIAD